MEQASDSNAENIMELPQPQPKKTELNARLDRLLKLQPEPHHPPQPRIQEIPGFLVNKNLNKYRSPQMISFGPIHYHELLSSLGQQLKTTWARRYVDKLREKNQEQSENANDRIVSLYETITTKIPELKNLFSNDIIQRYNKNDGQLADMLFVDGCALLFFMDAVDERHPEKVGLVKLDQLTYIWRDAILLENQLPIQLLELLSYKDQESQLHNSFYNFLFMGLPRRNREDSLFTWSDERKPAHLLDYIRLFYTSSPLEVKLSLLDVSISFRTRLLEKVETLPLRQEDPWHIYKNIRDLRNVGIQVKANTSEWKWGNISFTSNLFSGQLMLPGIVVDDVAPYLYYNMIAYEMLPDSQNSFQCCSYFFLMDSLIDDAEDVKELRLAGVLQNFLGSDEEVAKLFNQLGGLLPAKMFNCTTKTGTLAYNDKYIKIKHQIDKHYRNKWKTWRAQLHTTYFNNPWSIIAFLAAVLALFLTSVQTWYAVFPK
ncbi:uncharacterized protein LOC107628201 [Arachis ipaensis]|uniref:Uncharacterized protein n=1 Tax=Arachis hypogaea TaxID=3818 RepID=A0A445AEM3_ARAHY|nr:uncharacterized protein LOC107628201 [Arachis ipaensis]XP_025632344.1 uncharacterized protein LOC112726978 [Arachis hypogaea]QHO23150.1 UPF0481 protein [Arachis hypogaea]QHO23151.1 UPF0481 protein [Arachis hypogaea]QHO23152.1 UPF0481 protein [Arachis hypogaea]RYR24861.1 hypothetical protein Ahy_B02g058412 [Arachis hypogaea]